MKNLFPIFLLLISAFGFAKHAAARDTIRIMHYNLLYYGEITGFCNATNNNPQSKENSLRTILAHDLPDIFTVNEMSKNELFHQRILDSAFSKITQQSYARASCPNLAGSNIVNMLYYNELKLTLHRQEVVQSSVRDIDLYTLYYNSPDLAGGDTVFLHCMVAHLKAGSSSSDAQDRATMTLNALNYLKAYKQPGNYLFMGDLNLYSSSEQSYQHLLYYSSINYRFYDPLNMPGSWSDNPDFSSIHTQSTHTAGSCFSTGGMDDRFDFILISKDIQLGYDKVKYLPGSYRTMGQDGMRLNKSLLDTPQNTSAPYPVIEALYNNSDHLPILLSLEIDQTPASISHPNTNSISLSVSNPVGENLYIFHHGLDPDEMFSIELISLYGERYFLQKDTLAAFPYCIPVSYLPRGFYLLSLRSDFAQKTFKIIKL